MNRYIGLRSTALSFFILALFACNQKAYSSDTLTALPFDLWEWVEWRDAIDREEMDDDGRYKWTLLSKNKKLQKFIDEIYSQYINTHYFILKNGRIDCNMYMIVYKKKNEKYGLHYNLVNIREDKEIASLQLGGLLGNDTKNFIISEDLKITTFDEKRFYDEEEERSVVLDRKKTGEYQVQKDCKIVKLE